MPVRKRLIRRLVDDLLDRAGVCAAPVPVDEIAQEAGAQVTYESAEDSLSGFLYRAPGPGKRPIIGINEDHPKPRQRFSVAHELGHFLLHSGDQLHVDRGGQYQIKLRNEESSKGIDPEEKEANAFAAELLMPQKFLESDLDEIRSLNDEAVANLAERYEVSQQAMAFRLANLGYIELE